MQAERKTGKEAKSQIRNECSDEFLDWWQDKQGYVACQLFNFNSWDVHTVETDYFGDFKKRKVR